MSILRVLCAAGLVLVASSCVSAAAGRRDEPLALLWKSEADANKTDWICHYKVYDGHG